VEKDLWAEDIASLINQKLLCFAIIPRVEKRKIKASNLERMPHPC
jgi:hypothetical protein